MHQLPELPYSLDALAPVLSPETLQYHHGKHHRTYVDKLNDLIRGTPDQEASLETLVENASGAVFNNAAQHYNHSLYWQSLSPDGGATPAPELEQRLTRDFGSVQQFQDAFTQAALARFGSGWCWLVETADGALAIETTSNADCPLTRGLNPLLVCDVWEHAYYIDYRNDRGRYLADFWKLVNWQTAAERLSSAS